VGGLTDNYTLFVATQVGTDATHKMDLSDTHRVLSGCCSIFPRVPILSLHSACECSLQLAYLLGK